MTPAPKPKDWAEQPPSTWTVGQWLAMIASSLVCLGLAVLVVACIASYFMNPDEHRGGGTPSCGMYTSLTDPDC